MAILKLINPTKQMKPGDYILIAVLLFSAVLHPILQHTSASSSATAVVFIGDRQVMEISMQTDSLYHLQGVLGPADIEVADGHVHMLRSTCPHQTCMKMGWISQPKEVVVCIPNRILIRIEGKSENDLDGVTQ
jgi:hypothetical protein